MREHFSKAFILIGAIGFLLMCRMAWSDVQTPSASANLVPLRRLDQSGATNGQVATWNATQVNEDGSLGRWVPQNSTGSSTSAQPFQLWYTNNSTGQIYNTNSAGVAINGPLSATTISAQVENVSDIAAHLDTNQWPLGVLTWPLDAQMIRMGDGSTHGGVNAGVRYWPTPTNAFLADGRPGELAVSQDGQNSNSAAILGPILWFNGGGTGTNLSSGTNWMPIVAFYGNQQTNFAVNALTNPTPVITTSLGTNGANITGSSTLGFAGAFGAGLTFIPGSGGNAFDTSGNNAGGNGGPIVFGVQILGGSGGNATGATGFGGNGGNAGFIIVQGGNGGNDSNGNGGGTGGSGGNWTANGGKGADAQGGGAGGNGGNAGIVNMSAANGVGTVNGGAGGSLNTFANGIFSGGTIATSATSVRNGGKLTAVGSTYVPVTIFTTTTSAGPNASASETSLLGTAAFLTPPVQQASGKTLCSNVVDHAGRTLVFRVTGAMTNKTGTVQLKVKLGTTVIISTDVVTLTSSANVTNKWRFTGEVTFRTTGSSATTKGNGFFEEFAATSFLNAFATTNLSTITIDTTTDQAIDCTATFASSDGQMFGETAVFRLED